MTIPKSTWSVRKTYFKVKLVEDFEDEYWNWWFDGESNATWETSTDIFVESVITKSNEGVLELYQFPSHIREEPDSEADYFEKEDDNHVIPFHLFETI